METILLNAQVRTESKKGPSRRLRAEGFTPAIFYGSHTESIMLSVRSFDLKKVVEKGRKESLFVKLEIEDGKKKAEKLSILKDVQIDTLKKSVDHADFYEIRMDRELAIDVPISLTGEAPGVEDGGELSTLKRELKISGLPSMLPEIVEVDISNLGIGDSVKVEDVHLPDGVNIIDADDMVIASVAAARAAMSEVGAEEEVGEAPEGVDEVSEGEKEKTEEKKN
jgi:large subunit ribosomal protein L25